LLRIFHKKFFEKLYLNSFEHSCQFILSAFGLTILIIWSINKAGCVSVIAGNNRKKGNNEMDIMLP
jgi:hypothetical protein